MFRYLRNKNCQFVLLRFIWIEIVEVCDSGIHEQLKIAIRMLIKRHNSEDYFVVLSMWSSKPSIEMGIVNAFVLEFPLIFAKNVHIVCDRRSTYTSPYVWQTNLVDLFRD